MPSAQKLEEQILCLNETLSEIKNHELGIHEMLEKLSEAVEIYRTVQNHFENGQMSVHEIKIEVDGTFSESHFDWKDM